MNDNNNTNSEYEQLTRYEKLLITKLIANKDFKTKIRLPENKKYIKKAVSTQKRFWRWNCISMIYGIALFFLYAFPDTSLQFYKLNILEGLRQTLTVIFIPLIFSYINIYMTNMQKLDDDILYKH